MNTKEQNVILDVDFFMDSQGPYAVVSITDEDSGRTYKRSSDGEWEPKDDDLPIDEKEVYLESIKDLDLRVSNFINWIRNREEQNIAVVSHGTYISRITNIFLDNCEFNIWHPDNG